MRFGSFKNNVMHKLYFPGLCWASGIRTRWGIKINGRFEAERLPALAGPALAGPALGGQAATFVPYV